MVVELKWRLEFSFEGKLASDAWGRCAQAYIGVWEESRSFRIQVRDKIRV
jgi:hypothetical protein